MSEIKQVPLYLAPMAGITDKLFRRICMDHGCDVSTTEMISAQGLLTAPKDARAYQFLLERDEGEGALIAQIFGKDPQYMEDAARKLTDMGRFSGIDINMGCPAPKVTGGGSGSALMKTPELAAQIIRHVCHGTLLPVTVKIRLGWDENSINAVEMAKIAEDCGACAVTVHGRTRQQHYSGEANWEEIAKVKAAVGIRVIANGDVVDADSARRILETTGCDGIAVGRGALGNPWLFAEIKACLAGVQYEAPSYQAVVAQAMAHARSMVDWKGERNGVMEMRKHFGWYISTRRGARKIRTAINLAESLDEVENLLLTLEG